VLVVLATSLAAPLGLIWALAGGDEGPGLASEGPDLAGERSELAEADPIDETDGPRDDADATSTARPVCADRPAPDLVDELHPADLEGRGCTVLVGWDGQHLHVPHDDGTVARYDLGAGPRDVLLVGDWTCDGRDAPALYRPEDGQLFLFDTVAEEATARGRPTGVAHGSPTVVTDADGCAQVRVGPAS
jgi:hypothetical protein